MSSKTASPRPYRSKDSLKSVIEDARGAIHVSPQSADRIVFDIAHTSYLPENLPESRNGSRVLDIGRGVQVRASGSIHRDAGGKTWSIRSTLYGAQYPSGREMTAGQLTRARMIIESIITTWALAHEGDIQQADDIERNNAARTLEEAIAEHEEALAILRQQLAACEEGESYSEYPTLPTNGRH